ncbi:MAG: hypothetical protein ACSLE3_01810 [Microbacteriaceae bacterium]
MGDLLEDLELSDRQVVDGHGVAAPDQGVHDAGVQDGLADEDLTHGEHDAVDGRHLLLQQVGGARRPAPQQLEREPVGPVGQDHDPQLRMVLAAAASSGSRASPMRPRCAG